MLLFIDNSNPIIRILLQSQDFYTEYHLFNNKDKANSIISDINLLLAHNGLTAQQITKVAYINSGLSFTGLRIALSIILAIAYVNKAQIFPIDPYRCLLLQYASLQSSLAQGYYAVILPNYKHRSSLAIIKHNDTDQYMAQSQTVARYNIDLNQQITIELTPEVGEIDSITVISSLAEEVNASLPALLQIRHQQNEIAAKWTRVNNFELSAIGPLILNHCFADIAPGSADLIY